MKIVIETIPHEEQIHDSAGDYIMREDGTMHILASETGNDDYNFLLGIHELIEAYLTLRKGIPWEDIYAFDKKYEEERREGLHSEDDEPGDDPKAPYMLQHNIASFIEIGLAEKLGIDWKKYADSIPG